MDLSTRKYNLIQELIQLDQENILELLERILKEANSDEPKELSEEIRNELDNRLESYRENPNDLLDWKEVKNNW